MRPKIPITKASSTEHIHFQGVIVTLHSLAIFKAAGDFGIELLRILELRSKNNCIQYLESPTGMSNTEEL